MWLFKNKAKKKIDIQNIDSKFKIGDSVRFIHDNESSIGSVIRISKDDKGNIKYDINVGGECPWTAHGVDEVNVKFFVKFNG